MEVGLEDYRARFARAQMGLGEQVTQSLQLINVSHLWEVTLNG